MKLLAYMIITIGTISCASIDPLKSMDGRIPLSKHNLEQLEGEYFIHITDTNKVEAKDIIYFNALFEQSTTSDERIKIEKLNNHNLKATLFSGDSIVDSSIIRGRLKDNQFLAVTEHKTNSFLVLFQSFTASRSRLGVMENRNLVIDSRNWGCATFLVMPIACSEGFPISYTFERAK